MPRNVTFLGTKHGLPAIIYDLKCTGSQAYIALAKEFLERSSTMVVNKKLIELVIPFWGVKQLSNKGPDKRACC